MLALVVVGAAATSGSASTAFRRSTCRRCTVRTTLPGGAPEEVESEVTEAIEEAVNTVEGINELRSVSASGTSFVIATFDLDRDIDIAAAGRARPRADACCASCRATPIRRSSPSTTTTRRR